MTKHAANFQIDSFLGAIIFSRRVSSQCAGWAICNRKASSKEKRAHPGIEPWSPAWKPRALSYGPATKVREERKKVAKTRREEQRNGRGKKESCRNRRCKKSAQTKAKWKRHESALPLFRCPRKFGAKSLYPSGAEGKRAHMTKRRWYG